MSTAGRSDASAAPSDTVRLCLSGDLMVGRGIDQVLPRPSDPVLYESYVSDAREYVALAEARNGPIPKPVSYDYIWGDALGALRRASADVRIVNLETSITTSDAYWPGKGINYRMHPDNVPCLTAAAIDCCTLANNHVLDWGYAGLEQTLQSLRGAGIRTAGAGADGREAARPAAIDLGGGARVLVLAYASATSGTPLSWAAAGARPGVNLLTGRLDDDVAMVTEQLTDSRHPGDIAVVSIHWGSNWGYSITAYESELAHRLIDDAGADIIHGHSSHHPKGIEVHRGKLVLYGCGDLLNDYEGIAGREHYRGDLSLLYLPTLASADGRLIELEMLPLTIRRFRLNDASPAERTWLRERLDRESRRFGGWVEAGRAGTLVLRGLSTAETVRGGAGS